MDLRRLRLPGHEALDPVIIESVYELKRTDPGKKANRLAGGWHSTDQSLASMPGLVELVRFVVSSSPGMRVYLLWSIVNPRGVGNPSHGHGEVSIVCVYYPRSHPASIVFHGEEDVPVLPEAGLLLSFGGPLAHSVEENRSDVDRISITFDMKPA